MRPLQGQSLTFFQKDLKDVEYILIDELSFLGPKLFLKVDTRLREAFPERQHQAFGGLSVILVGDLAQLPPVMDKPIYASHSIALMLWHTFNIVITLDTIFRQQGESQSQRQFRDILQNIRNAQPLHHDWEVLMKRTNAMLTTTEIDKFNTSMHLFATNNLALLHNRRMLKLLNVPIAISVAQKARQNTNEYIDDEQLQEEVLLCIGQRVMLTTNLWIETGLVNGSLGQIKAIVYNDDCKPPDLPLYVVIKFDNYIGPAWDKGNPNYIPVPPVTRGNRRQLPLAMAWAITIHKSQGLTLDRATINIGEVERQALLFTAISRVRSIDNLRIEPAFSFARYCKMQNSRYTTIRKKEEARLQILSSKYIQGNGDHQDFTEHSLTSSYNQPTI